jgi:hypothetical protein
MNNNLELRIRQRRDSNPRNLRPRGLFRGPDGEMLRLNPEDHHLGELMEGDGPNAGFDNQNPNVIAHIYALAGHGNNAPDVNNAHNNAPDDDAMDVDAMDVDAAAK